MATATVDSSICDLQNHLHTESLPLIDLRHLSQSELLSLSFCSSSPHRLRTDTADVSTPKIDRSVFNESAGSRKQTFSRLRLAPRNNNASPSSNSTPAVPFQNTERQPLDEENSQIISLLKSLFGSDSNSIENKNEHYHKLVSIPVIYNDYMRLPSTNNAESQNVSIDIWDSSQGGVKRLEVNHSISIRTAESSSKKRKRGRPRKNENVNFDNNDNSELVENKTIAVVCDNVKVESNKKEEMVMVNKNGVVVDFVALGNMEDPYGEELRRRTEGMQLKAEFLGFLEGFEGEWGSMRKKRRIVDASLFGDVLPIGWKLSICIKKQAGRVWLACTRYISPNGQQFVSCKEVSSYLLSFSGLHDVSRLNFGHMDGRIKLTDKITPSIPADHTRKDGKNENDFISYVALPVTCRSIETGGCPVEVQMGNKYKCHKCTVAFDKQDDLLQHLLSHQRAPKRLRFGTSTNEEVIIKNGKYECQFCHKLFEERHRFNGHLGNHIKEYLKRLDASNGKTTGESDEPALVKIPPGAGKIQTLIEFDRDSDAITVNTKISDEINSTIPYCELKAITSVETHCGEQDRVFISSNDGAGKMNEDTDAVAAENRVSSEPALLNNDIHRSSDETDVPKCPTNGTGDLGRKDIKNCSVAGGARDVTCIGHNNSNHVSPCLIEELNQERDSNCGLLASNAKVNTSNDDIIEDRHCSSPIDNMVIDGWGIDGKGEPITGCCNSYAAMGGNAAVNLREQTISEGCYVADSETGLFTFNAVETMLEKGSKGGLTGIENNMNSVCTGMSNESRFDDVVKSGTNEITIVCCGDNTVLADDNVTSNEQGENHGAGSVIPFLNQHTHLVENTITGAPKCILREPCQGKESEDCPITTSGNEQLFDFESNVIKVSNGTIDVANHDQVGSEIDLVPQTLTSIKQEDISKTFTFAPFTNGFASKDYGISNSVLEKLEQGRNSGRGSSDNEQSHDVKDIVNGLSFTVEEDNQQEVKISCNGELHITSDDNCTEQDADVGTGTVQKCSLFAGSQLVFTAKDNPTSPYSGAVDELKQKMDSVESAVCPSGSEPVWSVEKNLLTAFTGSVQEEPRVENSENPRKDDSGIGFSSHPGPDESDVISEFMWRNDEESNLLSDFADTSCQPVQTSSFFPPYDAVSDKGESELFAEKFGATSGFEGLKLGGMDNMECNLPTSQVSSHSDESKVGTYDAVIPKGITSSIWLAKEDLPFVPKDSSRHHVPAVCVWCGREICQEALESEGQTSTMGFMCAECTAKLPGQFNG